MEHPDGMIGLTATDADTDLPAASSDAAEDFVITENVESELYEATVNGKLAAGLLYSRTGDRVLLLATSVFPEFRGQGVTARLLGGVLDSLREDKKTATVSCPFAAAYIRAHPEYADVVDTRFPGNPHGHHH